MPADHSCVSSSAKITPVNGERITPPTTEASPISAQKPGATAGNAIASSAPSAPPIMNTGANTPPEVPEPSDKDQIRVLTRSEEHTSELQSLMRNSYAVFCLKK